jgi:glycosyltransferase involved in cell wall biosynthesis
VSARRVAIITHGGIDPPGTGIRIPFLVGLIERLQRSVDLTIFSPDASLPSAPEIPDGVARRVYAGSTRATGSIRRPLSLGYAVLREHRRVPFDLLHGIWALPSGVLAVSLGKWLGLPSVVSLHGAETASVPSIAYGNLLSRPKRLLTLWTSRNASALTLLSAHQQAALARAGVNRADPVIVPPASDPSFCLDRTERSPGRVVHFLHVANLTEVKDQPTMLEAFRLIAGARPSRLRVIGADYLQGAVQRRAKALGIGDQVEFLGYLPPDELPQHYLWADILLHTSFHEAGGVVVAEAAAAGVPVFGTRTGLMADLADNVTVVVEPGDSAGLAERVLAALDTPDCLTRMRTAGQAWARAHTIETSARLILETYERLTPC